jgi:hypothetical protein
MEMTTRRKPRAPRKPPGRGSATTPAEEAAIGALSIAGMSQRQIAEQTGRSRETIARVLSKEEFAKARESARSILASSAEDVARNWLRASEVAAENGRHEASRDLLVALKAVDPPNATRGTDVPAFTVKIGVLLPGLGPNATLGLEAGSVVEGSVAPNDGDDTA